MKIHRPKIPRHPKPQFQQTTIKPQSQEQRNVIIDETEQTPVETSGNSSSSYSEPVRASKRPYIGHSSASDEKTHQFQNENIHKQRCNETIIEDICGHSSRSKPKSHAARMKETEEKWNTMIPSLQKEYVNCFKNGEGPKCTDANPPPITFEICDCTTKTSKVIRCFYYTGVKKIKFTFCRQHEEEPITLLRNHLFAASPSQPGIAFHLSFLECDNIRKSLGNTYAMYQRVKSGVDQQLTRGELEEIPEDESTACS
ncbi:hypothetical protein INT45_010568 [Circinella minor]|uniref:Uncharacterized protein n=1 Tax=Circinella minor TaxID=1195481 RepID=A0A8H7SA54_9FUNG|nr:hypothetical protein INT45_010568 [Circinella minor]